MGRDRRYDLKRIRLPEAPDGRFWYPVLETKLFTTGDIVWIDHGDSIGRHEVRAVGSRELLVRPIPWWEFRWRLWKGRVRRWWLRR